MMGTDVAFRTVDASQQGLALAGDYHSGPLSVIIPFGIWGAMAFLWLLIAGAWAMYSNYRYGDESLRTINTFLWVSCVLFIFRFFFIFGGLNSDMMVLAGMIGLSVALNGGVRRPAPQPVQAQPPMVYPAKILPHPAPFSPLNPAPAGRPRPCFETETAHRGIVGAGRPCAGHAIFA